MVDNVMTNIVSRQYPRELPVHSRTPPVQSEVQERVMSAFSETQSSADLVLTTNREYTYMLVDALGTGGQAATIISLLSSAATIATAVADVFIPVRFLVTGALGTATGTAWTVPDAQKGLEAAKAELKDAGTDFAATVEAKKAVEMAELGVTNQQLYRLMGLGQIAAGSIGICSSTHLGFSPILTGQAASVSGSVAGAALGAVYVVRGMVMLNRSLQNYRMVNSFHNYFMLGSETLDKGISLMKKVESRGGSFMDRRIDSSCLTEKSKDGNTIERYTSGGIIKVTRTLSSCDEKDISEYKRRFASKADLNVMSTDGKVIIGQYTPKGFFKITTKTTEYKTDEAKKDYLARVDKGIYTEELKHKVAAIIAAAMIIGGIIAIITSVFLTGGLSFVILGVASAVFFASMESIFLTYDSSSIFKKVRDRLYTCPDAFKTSLSPGS
jgi:hypothetical protein